MPDPDKKQVKEPPADDLHPVARALFGWVEHALTGRIILIGLLVLSLGLVGVDLFYHRHVEQDIESISGFYGLYGFVAFSVVVLMGRPLGWLLRRDEDYYGDAEDADGGVS